MEEQFYMDRCKLRELVSTYPEWSHRELGRSIDRSPSWVKKWLRRLRSAPLGDPEVLKGQSRVRTHPPTRIAQEVEERILELRDHPPEHLGRIPGPVTLLYYLKQDERLRSCGAVLPHSTRTVWRILDRNQRILRSRPPEHEPEERPIPGEEWGMDFKDVSSVPADPQGKQQQAVEILNIVDHGDSEVVVSVPREDYTAETALGEIAGVLQAHGRPERIRLDRDPR